MRENSELRVVSLTANAGEWRKIQMLKNAMGRKTGSDLLRALVNEAYDRFFCVMPVSNRSQNQQPEE